MIQDPPHAEATPEIEACTMLVLSEWGWGSVLHAFHVPLGGHVLSLNQAVILANLTGSQVRSSRFVSFQVSVVGAMLKSLSPIGKKITPMLAISMQGLLFSLGVATFGSNFLGVAFGTLLLCLWPFAQPLLFYLIVFGPQTLGEVVAFYEKRLPQWGVTSILSLIVFVVFAKVAVGLGLTYLAFAKKSEVLSNWQSRMITLGLHRFKLGRSRAFSSHQPQSTWGAIGGALRDLTRPLVLVSFAMTGLFLFFSIHENAEVLRVFLRPVASAFIVFFLLRRLPFQWVANGVQRLGGSALLLLLRQSRKMLTERIEKSGP